MVLSRSARDISLEETELTTTPLTLTDSTRPNPPLTIANYSILFNSFSTLFA